MTQPKIRFNGFSDEWAEKKLGELLKERKATQPQSNDAPLVSFTVENGVTPKTDRYDREGLVTGDKYAKRYKLTLLDDIVYNPANLKLGAISRNKFGKAVFSPIYVTYFQKDGDSDMRFVEMIVTSDSFIKHVRKYEQGTVYERQSVSSSDMLKAVIQLPTLPEQQKIGSLFSKYDAIIALREQKLEELNALKKGMLQQMFDDGVATSHKPQVRFSGFNEVWLEKKLGDLSNITTGKLDANAMSKNGEYDFYTSGIKKYRINEYAFEGEAITIAGNGANVGYLHIADGKFNAYQRTYVLQDFKVNREFIYFDIGQKLPHKIFQESRTGSIPYIVIDMLMNLKLMIPSLPEQQKIGQLFKQLDARISNEQTKIEQLKAQKQGLLQRML